MTGRPAVTVVIPTRDRPVLLERALLQLAPELREGDKVVVVDSASTGSETRAVAERRGARYVRAETPGVSLARNLGWRAADHEQVAFIDDDILVDQGWLDAIATTLAEPGVDFVTGRVELPEESAAAEHASSLVTDTERRRLDAAATGWFGASCNMAATRSALAAVGGFDERFGPPTWIGGAEDVDLFDRLVEAGRVGWYEPRACVRHVQWRDERQVLGAHWAYGKGMGARIAAMSWRDRRRARRMAPQMLRLEGVKTAVGDVKERRRRSWGPPIVWRVGALAGFAVGVVRLRRPVAPGDR